VLNEKSIRLQSISIMNRLPCPRGIMCPDQGDASHVRQFSHSSSFSPHLGAMGLNFMPPHQHQPQPQLFHHALVGGGGGGHALVVGGGGGRHHALVVGGGHALVVGGGRALVVGGGGHAGGVHPGGPCRHGSACYRTNPLHFAKYSHPPGHAGGGGHHGRGGGGGGHRGGHGGGGGHARGGGGRGGSGLVLIHTDYSRGPAVFLVETPRGLELPYGTCNHGEGSFECATREGFEEMKGVFDVSNTMQRLERVTSSSYANQCVYVANVEPAAGQKKGLYTRQMFSRNHRVLRGMGAGPEFFETSGVIRVRIVDLQSVFAASSSNTGLVLVGTNRETGVLRRRDASYLRRTLASNLHLTAPTLLSTFVRDTNGLETYHLH